MEQKLFPRYVDFIRDADTATLEREIAAPDHLRLSSDHRLTVAYAPFDHVVPTARIVIVGITPGRQQMRNALLESRRLLRAGASLAEALAGAKVHASFSGAMRSNLVAMLDFIGANRLLGIGSTAALWSEASELVHFTSALRYPVFVDGANYSGNPDMVRTPFLRDHLDRWFGSEVDQLRNAIYVPLGPKVDEAVRRCVPGEQVLSGLPHPSGANAERIAFFLGRKARGDLSAKVAPDRLLAARDALLAKMSALGA